MTKQEFIEMLEANQVIVNGEVEPMFVITAIAAHLGWDMAVETPKDTDQDVRGMIIGTDEYVDYILKGGHVEKTQDESTN